MGADGSFVDKKRAALKYKAPAEISDSRTVVITAHAPAIGFASMRVFLEPDAQSDGQPLFWLRCCSACLEESSARAGLMLVLSAPKSSRAPGALTICPVPDLQLPLRCLFTLLTGVGFSGVDRTILMLLPSIPGMVGLFSDSVLERMKQALDHLIAFTDPRPDKMPGSNAGKTTSNVVPPTTTAKFAGKIDQHERSKRAN